MLLNSILFSTIYCTKYLYKKKENSHISDLSYHLKNKSILKEQINFSPLRIMFAVGLSYIAFIMLRYVPSIPAFWRALIINGC